MDTVLQGPDGGPAIDQQSGMPLTMEEMLRRRGIVRMGNTTSMLGPNSAASAQAPSPNPAGGVQASTGQTSNSGAANPAVTAAMMAKTLPPELKDAPPQVAAQTLSSSGADPSVVQALEALGVVAIGTAAAYAAYRGLRGRGGNAEMPIREGMPKGVPEDAHFTDVGPAQVAGPQTTKALKGQQQARLSAPQKKLSGPAAADTTTAVAKTMKKSPRVSAEPLDAGLARTLGVPSELAKMLKANPGLLKTLTRIP